MINCALDEIEQLAIKIRDLKLELMLNQLSDAELPGIAEAHYNNSISLLDQAINELQLSHIYGMRGEC